jgi:hypothetical protein
MKKQIVIALMLVSTTVLADSHSEKKDAMKKEAPPAGAAMEQPKPPAEIAAMQKMMVGNWKCTGKAAMDPANPAAMTDFKGTFTSALDASLDKFWIKGTWTGTAGKLKMKGQSYTTYDGASKKWTRIMLDNWGMSGSETSSGLPAGATEGKIAWEGESRMMGMVIKGKTTEDVTAKSMSMKVEMSPDGKKWATGMEMTCKK